MALTCGLDGLDLLRTNVSKRNQGYIMDAHIESFASTMGWTRQAAGERLKYIFPLEKDNSASEPFASSLGTNYVSTVFRVLDCVCSCSSHTRADTRLLSSLRRLIHSFESTRRRVTQDSHGHAVTFTRDMLDVTR